jgi:hypothetical protein
VKCWQAGLVLVGAALLLGGQQAEAQNNATIQIVRNRYIRVLENPTELKWTITRLVGDPLTPLDDNLSVLWNDVAQGVPERATFLVSSNTAAAGFTQHLFGTGDGLITQNPTLDPDGRSITSAWQIPTTVAGDAEGRNLQIQQKLSMVRDLVRIEYTIVNLGSPRQVGMRLAVDPSPDNSDLLYFPVFTPGPGGFFVSETDFRPNLLQQRAGFELLPDEWYQYVDGVNPFTFTKGLLHGLDATPPNRMVFAGYNPLVGGTVGLGSGAGLRMDNFGRITNTGLNNWDYAINPTQNILGLVADNGDPCVALYYGPRPLATGQRWVVVAYIGVGVASHGLAGPGDNPVFVGAAEAPFAVPLSGGVPQDVQVYGFAQNLHRDFTVPQTAATVLLPEGLELSPATPDNNVPLGDLDPIDAGAPNEERQTNWTLVSNGQAAGILPINLTIDSPLGSASVRRDINVPQGIRYRIRQDFGMYTFPFTFTNASPDVVLGLASSDFQIIRWNPDSNGGQGAYEPATVIRAGESYWIRLLGVLPFVDVTINGATPINIFGSGLGPFGGTFTPAQPLRPNWNMVGNPSPYAVVLKRLKFQDVQTGQVIDFDTAVTRRFLLGSVWRFDRHIGNYVQISRTDYVNPGEGIWIFATRPMLVNWPAPLGFAIQIS